MLRALVGLVATGFVCGAAAAASDDHPDFSADRFLMGRWSCDATQENRKAAREDATYSWGLDGRWLKLTYTLHPGESDRKPKTTEAYETFDASLKKWVYFSFSSDGDYGISYSDGWSNGIKLYRPAEKDPQQYRYTFRRVSDRESTEVVEISSGSQWRVFFSLHCHKVD